MSRLLLNDRVEVVAELHTNTCDLVGLVGRVVIQGRGMGYDVCIEFDEYIGGHNGDGRGKQGHCWYISQRNLIKIPDKRTFKQKIEDRCKYLYNH